MSTPVGVIKKFVKTLMTTDKTGTAAVDEAMKAVGAVRYDVFKSKYNTALTNTPYYQTSGAQTFAEQNCGIRINNEDTGAITGSDAGGKTTKTAESIVPESAKAVKLTKAEYNSFTKNGLTVNVTYAEKDDKNVDEKFNYSGATYLEKQKLVTRALYNWWIPESLDLINESLGINFTDGRANINKINVIFSSFGDGDSFHRYTRQDEIRLGFNYDMGLASEVNMYINADFLYNMTADDKNGVLEGGDKYIYSDLYGYGSNYRSANFTNYLDRLILQAMAEITLKANVPSTNYTTEIGAGLVEIVGGYDSASTGYSLFVNPNSTSAKGYHGYGYMRYLAKNYSDGVPDGISYNAKKTALTVTTDFTDKTLDLTDFASTVKNVNAKALKSDVIIIGNAKDNSIVGGSGNDSLNGGAGNDSLTGGKGDDVFIYTAGNDVITDYAAGDKISVGAAIKNSTLSGSDVVFTIGKNTLTVKNAKDKTLTLINSKGKESTTVVSGDTNLILTDSNKAAVTLESGIKTADASARTKKIKIVGNTSDNSIVGGSGNDTFNGGAGMDTLIGGDGKDILYGGKDNDELRGNAGNDKLYGEAGDDILKGGKGNDSLWGGAGNDTLIGGDGKDVFVYKPNEGTDTIFDYASGDMLKILKSNGKDGGTFSKASFSGDELTLTISGGGKVIFEDVSSGDKININGKSYTLKGSTLK